MKRVLILKMVSFSIVFNDQEAFDLTIRRQTYFTLTMSASTIENIGKMAVLLAPYWQVRLAPRVLLSPNLEKLTDK